MCVSISARPVWLSLISNFLINVKSVKVFVRRSLHSDCHEINKLLCQHNGSIQAFGVKSTEDINHRGDQLHGVNFGYFVLYSGNLHSLVLHPVICAIFLKNLN